MADLLKAASGQEGVVGKMVDSNASVLVVSTTWLYMGQWMTYDRHSFFYFIIYSLFFLLRLALYRRMGQDDSISFLGADFDGSFFQDDPRVTRPDRKRMAVMRAPLSIQDRRYSQ